MQSKINSILPKRKHINFANSNCNITFVYSYLTYFGMVKDEKKKMYILNIICKWKKNIKTRYHILEQIYCNILKNKIKGFALLGVKNFLCQTRGI